MSNVQFFDITEYGQSAPEIIPTLHASGEVAQSVRGLEVLSMRLNQELVKSHNLDTPKSDRFERNGATPLIKEFVEQGVFLFMERESHQRIRKVFARAFAVREVTQFAGVVSEVAQRLVSELIERGGGDLYDEFARRISSEALCRFIGVPAEDMPPLMDAVMALHRLGENPLAPNVKGIENALNVLGPYAQDLVDQRRAHPQNDFVSSLVAAEGDEGKLRGSELIWGTANLLMAGIATTGTQMCSTLFLLLENKLWDDLASNPDLVESAITESMRLYSVPSALQRIATTDFEIGGVHASSGDSVILNLLAAGRDPAQYDAPERFNITRDADLLTFGGGVHRCIGERFAWAEMSVAIRAITAAAAVEMSGEAGTPLWSGFCGVRYLPVTVTARS